MKITFSVLLFIVLLPYSIIGYANEHMIKVKADKKDIAVGQPITLSFTLKGSNIDSVRWDNRRLFPSIIFLKQQTSVNYLNKHYKKITCKLTFAKLDSGILIIPSMPIKVYSRNKIIKFHSSHLSIYFKHHPPPFGTFLTPIKSIYSGLPILKSATVIFLITSLPIFLIFIRFHLHKNKIDDINYNKALALADLLELKLKAVESVTSKNQIYTAAYQIFLRFLGYNYPRLITEGISEHDILNNLPDIQVQVDEEKTIRGLLEASISMRFSPKDQPLVKYLTQIENFINTCKVTINDNSDVK